ncbi:hypothetical protein MN608_04818 [Microdochium nivale]|nr:hypothetical protein MN608_04818 [Microdochium nivale]
MRSLTVTGLGSLLVRLLASSAQALGCQAAADADAGADCAHLPDYFYVVGFRRNTTLTTDNHHETVFLSASFRLVDLDTGVDTLCAVVDARIARRRRRRGVNAAAAAVAVAVHGGADSDDDDDDDDDDVALQQLDGIHLTNRFACEDETVEFILEEDSGLTVVEKACPMGSSAPMEASGSIGVVELRLACEDTGARANCTSTEPVLSGDFVSLGPPPPLLPPRSAAATAFRFSS